MKCHLLIIFYLKPNHERKPLDELNAIKDEENIDEILDEKDHPVVAGNDL